MSQAEIRNLASRRVAVTGSAGFVGGVLCPELARQGFDVVNVGRADLEGALADPMSLEGIAGCRAVIHLAGRAHVLHDSSGDPSGAYRIANRDMTLALAEACVRRGVGRLVFVSSIHVNGSMSNRPFRPDDTPAPRGPYALSKLEAEIGLKQIALRSGLEVVIVRPPLVYGPQVKANFLRLLRLASIPLPLPLGAVSGRRSLIGVWNLSDALIRCIEHPAAAGRTLLVADEADMELPELIRTLSTAMGRTAILINVPERTLRWGAALIGMRGPIDKLLGTLQVDASDTKQLLQWQPPVSGREGLARTARWYAQRRVRTSG